MVNGQLTPLAASNQSTNLPFAIHNPNFESLQVIVFETLDPTHCAAHYSQLSFETLIGALIRIAQLITDSVLAKNLGDLGFW
uniref:Uncharacterized protein n=1 Tax=Solanum lycopersicum TaxID=4081 RepID=A0A3Q7EQL4_SOLLC